jgi:hypothetical protein
MTRAKLRQWFRFLFVRVQKNLHGDLSYNFWQALFTGGRIQCRSGLSLKAIDNEMMKNAAIFVGDEFYGILIYQRIQPLALVLSARFPDGLDISVDVICKDQRIEVDYKPRP